MTDYGPGTASELKTPKPKVIRQLLHRFSNAFEGMPEIPILVDYPHNTCRNLILVCVNFV